jgi:hypothetical protein
MNRIILIGNGFDLAHGLKTNYKNFLNWFWNNKIKKDLRNESLDENISITELKKCKNYEEIQNVLINYFNSTPEFKSRYEKMKNGMDEKSYKDFDLETKNLLNLRVDEYISKYFRMYFTFLKQISMKQKIQNWVDIEIEYYNALLSIVDNVKKIDNVLHYHNIDELNEDFRIIKEELKDYLTEVSKEKIEQIPKLKTVIYDKFNYKDFTGYGIKEIRKKLYEEYKNRISNEDEKIMPLYKKITNIIEQGKEEIYVEEHSYKNEEQYFSLSPTIFDDKYLKAKPKDILFLNFNYTNTASKYISSHFHIKKHEIVNIHGKLNNPENPIIFGYGDELDEDYRKILKNGNNKLLENVKSIKYGETYNYKRLLNFIESDNYQIFVMGHSCGNSDRTLLNTLFEHKNCQSIKIFYHKKFNDKGEKISDNFSDIYRNITRNFTNFSDLRAKVVDKTNSIPLPQIKS